MFWAILVLVIGIMILASANIIWIKETQKSNASEGVLVIAKRMQYLAYGLFAIAIFLTF